MAKIPVTYVLESILYRATKRNQISTLKPTKPQILSAIFGARIDERISHDVFIESRDVVDACTWYYLRPSIMKVAIPPVAVCTL